MSEAWEKEGVDYWRNPDCPREYLNAALVGLVGFVEGTSLSDDYFDSHDEQDVRGRIDFYEYVADK